MAVKAAGLVGGVVLVREEACCLLHREAPLGSHLLLPHNMSLHPRLLSPLLLLIQNGVTLILPGNFYNYGTIYHQQIKLIDTNVKFGFAIKTNSTGSIQV